MRALLVGIARLPLPWLLLGIAAGTAVVYLLDTHLRALLAWPTGQWPTAAVVWAALIEATAVVAVALGAVWLLRALLDRSVILEPLGVAKTLVDSGYSSETVGRALLHEIRTVVRDAETYNETADFRGASPGGDLDNIKLATTGLSIGTLIQLVSGTLGVRRQLVGGEVTEVTLGGEKMYAWTIRVANQKTIALAAAPITDFANRIRRAAESIVEAIDPYAAASYYESVDRWADVDRALDLCLSPENATTERWVHNLRGLCARRRQRFAEAVYHCRRAIALDGDWAFPRVNLGLALHAQGDYAGALGAFEAAERIDGADADIQAHWGDSLRALGRYDDAAQRYRRALELDAMSLDALRGLGSVELARRRFEDADAHFTRALALAPVDREALLGAAIAREHLRDEIGVAQAREKIAVLDSADDQPLEDFERLLLRRRLEDLQRGLID